MMPSSFSTGLPTNVKSLCYRLDRPRRRSRTLARFCLGRLAACATVLLLLRAHSCGATDPSCAECNSGGVHFSLPEENNTCQFVMHVPCQQSFMAFTPGTDCLSPFLDVHSEWSFVSGGAGLKLTRVDGFLYAAVNVEVAGSVDDVVEGAVTIQASDGDNTKTGSFSVQVSSASVCGGTCPGSSSSSASAPIGSTTSQNGSVQARFGLGRYAFGKKAGALTIKELSPTSLLSTPCCLKFLYGTNTACEVLTNGVGVRQIKSAEGLANIVTNSATRYYIDIYPLSQVGPKGGDGFYAVSNSPLQSITVENPDNTGSSSNQLRVVDGYGNTNHYCWQTNGWWLTNGGGYRKISKTFSSNNFIRTVSLRTLNSADGLVTTNYNTYQTFSFGEKVVHGITRGAAPLTNTYAYYTDTAASTTGLLQQLTYAQGYWEYSQYETNRLKTNTCMAFLNQAPTSDGSLCHMFEYGYGTNAVPGAGDKAYQRPGTPRRTVEYLLGHEISRTYRVIIPRERREIHCVNPGAAWNDPSNLVTITRWPVSGPNTSRIWTIQNPDGTMEVRDYWSGLNRTNIVSVGAPDGYKTNIVDGTKTYTVLGPVGQLISRTVIDIVSGITNSSEVYSDYDGYNRPRKVSYLDSTSTWTDYGCCGPINETNREGTAIAYYKDALQRQAATQMNNITSTNVLDAAGNLLKRTRIGSDGSQITQATNAYDSAGRRVSSTDALGNTTTYSETISNNQLTRTTTYPDAGTRIETFYRDGQLALISGTAVHPMRYTNGVLQDGGVWRAYEAEIKLDGNGSDTTEAVTNLLDLLGRTYKTVYSDGAIRQSFWSTNGQLTKVVDPDGVTTLYQYNAKGELEYTATDMDRNGTIDFAGTDRVRRSVRSVEALNAVNSTVARNYAWATNNSATSNLISAIQTSADGLITWSSSYGLTNKSQTFYAGSGNRYMTNTAPDGSYTVSFFQNGQLQSITRRDALNNELSSLTYAYDSHGRQRTVTDARNGRTTYIFDNADRVISVTTPPPGTGASGQTMTHAYDFAGRNIRTGLPDGGGVTNIYSARGEVLTNFGSRVYPVAYGYDAQGRKTNMITWTNFATRTGAATTSWKFNGYRGFMTNKLYADGKGPFTCTPREAARRPGQWRPGVQRSKKPIAAAKSWGSPPLR